MPIVNVHQAKTQLSRLLEQVEAGEEVIIARAGRPVARLVPLVSKKKRGASFGLLKGKLVLDPSWDADEVNEAIAADFCGYRVDT